MRVKNLIGVIGLFSLILWGSSAEALVLISEFLADPASGLAGDANKDGIRHSFDDEFVELYNPSDEPIDMSGWYITDAADTRHIFKEGSVIRARSLFVVFGGGDPNMPSVDWQIASSGSLALNNNEDTITLYDLNGQAIDKYTYGPEAEHDQSIVRNPEGTRGEWIKHTALPNADGRLFSPGYFINAPGQGFSASIPEPMTLLSFALGLGLAFKIKK